MEHTPRIRTRSFARHAWFLRSSIVIRYIPNLITWQAHSSHAAHHPIDLCIIHNTFYAVSDSAHLAGKLYYMHLPGAGRICTLLVTPDHTSPCRRMFPICTYFVCSVEPLCHNNAIAVLNVFFSQTFAPAVHSTATNQSLHVASIVGMLCTQWVSMYTMWTGWCVEQAKNAYVCLLMRFRN